MAKKRKSPPSPRVHPELKGFSIDVDALGEIRMNRSVEEISKFLRDHMPAESQPPEQPDPSFKEEEE